MDDKAERAGARVEKRDTAAERMKTRRSVGSVAWEEKKRDLELKDDLARANMERDKKPHPAAVVDPATDRKGRAVVDEAYRRSRERVRAREEHRG